MSALNRITSLLLKLRNRHFFIHDVIFLLALPSLALLLRTDSLASIDRYNDSLLILTVSFAVLKLAIFHAIGLYKRYWRFASIDEMAKIVFAVLSATVVQGLVFFMVLKPYGLIDETFPRSLPLLDGLLALLVIGGSRYSVRLAQRMSQRAHVNGDSRQVLVVGAGETGVKIVEEMHRHPHLGLQPVGFIDKDPDKQGMRIRGLNVMGNHEALARVVEDLDIDLVVIAIPSASGEALREIAARCEAAGVETKTMPGVYELLDEGITIRQLRDVQVEDLLRRQPVETNTRKVAALLKGHRVLITGAGGSIGSELCRQVLHFQPAELILLGHGENSIFAIENELRRRLQTDPQGPLDVRIHAVIADIRDRERMAHVFGLYEPDFVLHAAAHKHVPLMEANMEEAVTNNVMGTRNLLELSEQYGIERFVLISTDKAVNPTSVMGVTKRIAEKLVRAAAYRTGRAYAAVRFGNVLGSRGSVLEIFREQIKRGGPITVTHPDVKRYFMTIPEAVHLVLQAATMEKGGEVFLLEMGEPTRIVDLAQDLIRLSSRRGDQIEIVFTGLRPGEKLFEELSLGDESLGRTEHEKILICLHDGAAQAKEGRATPSLDYYIDTLIAAAQRGDVESVRSLLKELVPEYQPLQDQQPTLALQTEENER